MTDDVILDGIRRYKQEIETKKTDKQYIAHGSTWFSQRRWEDDYETAVQRVWLESGDDF